MKVSNINCCVPQCSSVKRKNSELSFHQFPSDEKLKKSWIQVLKIGKKVSKRMCVCSKHFQASDFMKAKTDYQRKRLKARCMPSQCLPVSSVVIKPSAQLISQREERKRRYNLKMSEIRLNNAAAEESVELQDVPNDETPNDDEIREIAKILLSLNDENKVEEAEAVLLNPTKEKGVQAGFDVFKARFDVFDLTDGNINTLTGIPTSKLLQCLIRLIITKELPTKRKLCIQEQIILTMMRIKQNISFAALSIMFRISATTCKNIFIEMVACLARILQTMIYWPDKDEIENNIPVSFYKMQNVRVILDCTEIPACKPKCLKCSIMLYSQYKGRHTLKYMISISPAGLITNVSLGYGGRASDSKIFEQSEVVHMLEPFTDKVMVDKGFLIDEKCEENFIEVLRPPFVKNGKLAPAQVRTTRTIARARVHVERAIQRLKLFKMLHGPVPWELVVYFDYIMLIVAGICNLSAPILSDERF